MVYEYTGFLKTFLGTPDSLVRDSLECVRFTADDLIQWRPKDIASETEWQKTPVAFKRIEEVVRVEGRFKDVRQIDNIAIDDPSFWVPLSSYSWPDDRFPVDLNRFPIAEITYRCTSPNARPAWLWAYPGGVAFDWLTPTQEWRTIARRIQHLGFPARVDALILRLYATSRTTESMEIESIVFREMSRAEAKACDSRYASFDEGRSMKRYALLDDYMPLGAQMDAGSSKRLAAMLGISLQEYWALVLEDIARHNHNTVALEGIDRFTAEEWRDLLSLAEQYSIRFFAIHKLPFGSPQNYRQEFIETHIKPYASSPSILAWSLYDEPPEKGFPDLLDVRSLVEEADPNHPMAVVTRYPNAFSLFAKHFPVCGMTHYTSHVPWQVTDTVKAHLAQSAGQQFWLVAPAFIYATDTPEWHTCPEMRLMMNLAFANGIRGWYAYAFHNDPIWIRGSCQRSLTGPFLTFSDLWAELSQRVEFYHALAPLFLRTHPEPLVEEGFVTHSVAHANSQLPKGIAPTSLFRLCDQEFELYCVVSNDTREMTTVHFDISSKLLKDTSAYDLTDFTRNRRWEDVPEKRHLEMFPGQQHVILLAKPTVAAHWRQIIAERLMQTDRRRLSFDLPLARAYSINTSKIEKMVAEAEKFKDAKALETMKQAGDMMLNMMYECAAMSETRSKILEVSAAICACDGSLCRLLGWGKADQARQLGFKVIPIARELSHLRLEWRRGRGANILEQCQNLAKRTLDLLAEIRATN